MLKKLITIVTALLISGSTAAQDMTIVVNVQDFFSSMNVIASQLALEVQLPEDGLEALWPDKVAAIEELPGVVAEVKDAKHFNKALGEGTKFAVGDIVILTPTKNSASWQVQFYTRGDGSWTNPDLKIIVGTLDFYSGCNEAGINLGEVKLKSLDGVSLLGTIEDPAAFARSLDGAGKVTRGTTVIVEPGARGTTVFIAHGSSDMPIWGFDVKVDKVVKVK